jgi:hypothetical protein
MEEKMARICWNSNNWRSPSGREGKSLDLSSYEYINGFGHEEWLFDLDKVINGFHYGAIQPVGRNQNLYKGQIFKILLYTYKADDKEWYWVGWLNNVTAISLGEAMNVYEEYAKRGWLDLMKEDIDKVGANQNELNVFSKYCFNVKFKPSEIIPVNNCLQLFKSDQKITHNRYTLLNIDPKIINSFETSKIEIIGNDLNKKHKKTFTKSFVEYSKEYEFTHGLIQDAFFDYLVQNFVNDKIKMEARITKLNNSIDIYQEKETGLKIIYEIKTYFDLRYSIRMALGQLFEYGYYPNRTENYKLIIVSDKFLTEDSKQYIDNLKTMFNIDIGLINFDHENRKIEEKFNCNGCDFA